jgi:hypothetical protein
VPLGGGKLWYWGTHGESSPWYPSVTILRQIDRESWASTMTLAESRLRDLVGGRASRVV